MIPLRGMKSAVVVNLAVTRNTRKGHKYVKEFRAKLYPHHTAIAKTIAIQLKHAKNAITLYMLGATSRAILDKLRYSSTFVTDEIEDVLSHRRAASGKDTNCKLLNVSSATLNVLPEEVS